MKAHILSFLFIFILLSFQSFASEPDSLPLSLSEAVEIALSNNLNLKIERISPEIQKNNLESAKSIFDPHLNFSAALSDKKTLPKRAETETFQANIEAGISKKLDYGTNVAVSCMIIDSNEETSLADQDSKSASGSLVISQPLLKNRGKTVNHRNIIVSENNLKKSNLDLKQAIINMVVQTQYLYWQVYSAKESLVVQKESLQLAQRFLEEVNMKIKVGGAANLDALQAKAEVASREERVIISENELINHQESLLKYIYGIVKEYKNIQCSQSPNFEPIDLVEKKMMNDALDKRTDHLSAQIDLKSAQVDLNYYYNQQLPNLDLTATATYYDGGTDKQLSGSNPYQDYYSGSLALSLQFPWGFRHEKSSYRSATLMYKKRKILLAETKAQILLEVRKAIRSLRAGYKRYEASTLAKNLANEKLNAESEKYKQGLSTSYNVLLYQRDLTDAKVHWVDAIINYQIAIINLYKATGITLEKNSIQLKEVL